MRHIFRVASLAGCILLAVSLVTTANADPVADFWARITDPDNPDQVQVGQTIRVAFVTSGLVNGEGTQLDYQSFSQGSAWDGLITGGFGFTAAEWKPLVSTTDDITKNDPWELGEPVKTWLDDYNAPVFNTAGERVAVSGSAMLGDNAVLDNAIRYDESGDDQTRGSETVAAWTGTDSNGVAHAVFPIDGQPVDLTVGSQNDEGTGVQDTPIATVGSIADKGTGWLESSVSFRQTGSGMLADGTIIDGEPIARPIYVMSGEVTVVPEPSTVLLWLGCSGLAGLIYWRKRRRS